MLNGKAGRESWNGRSGRWPQERLRRPRHHRPAQIRSKPAEDYLPQRRHVCRRNLWTWRSSGGGPEGPVRPFPPPSHRPAFTDMPPHRRSLSPVWRTPCVNITFEVCSLELLRRRHRSSLLICRRREILCFSLEILIWKAKSCPHRTLSLNIGQCGCSSKSAWTKIKEILFNQHLNHKPGQLA